MTKNINELEHPNDELDFKKIVNKIGNYLSGPEATMFFNCKNNEIVNECLSQMIKLLDEMLIHSKN